MFTVLNNSCSISQKQGRKEFLRIYFFFLVLSFIFVLPLMIANYQFLDDIYRSIYGITAAWKSEGRVVTVYLLNLLSGSAYIPNIFPLNMILAILIISGGMSCLAIHYFNKPTYAQCLVVLPIWFSPFLLQALSYQYDCVTITTSIFLAIYSITFKSKNKYLSILVPAVSLALSMSFYQISINIFIALVCLEIIRSVSDERFYKIIISYFFVFILGCLFYYLTSYQTITNNRGGFNLDVIHSFKSDFNNTLDVSLLIFNPFFKVFFFLLSLIAVGGVILDLVKVFNSNFKFKIGRAVFLIIAAVVLVLSVYGIMFLLNHEGYKYSAARTYLALSIVFVALFYYFNKVIGAFSHKAVFMLALPLYYFLCYSFAYGNELQNRKNYQNLFVSSVYQDIVTTPVIYNAKSIGIINYKYHNNLVDKSPFRLVTDSIAYKAYPALDFINIITNFALPEDYQKKGINNIRFDFSKTIDSQLPSFQLIYQRAYYNIYFDKANNRIYIKMKDFKDYPTNLFNVS